MLLFFIAAYFTILLLLGFLTRKSSSIHDFILAGRKISFPVLVASIVATFYGASAILGGAELSYRFGLGALWFMVPFYVGNVLVVFFLKRIESSSAETLPDFLGEFYGSKVVVATALLLSFLCLVPESIIAAGKVMHYLYPLSPEIWMTAVSAVVVAYTLLGGMRAVSYSDVSQFLLMVLALIFLFPYAINYSPNFISKIPRENLTPLTYFHMFPQDAIRWTILLLFLPITSAPLYIRFFASLRDVDRKKALVYSILTYVMADLIILTSGMIAYANSESLGLGDENADIAFIVLGLKILPDALKALFSLGIIAVIIGNTDAWLHSGASSLSYDVLRRLRCIVDDRRLVFYSQFFVFALGAISLVLALYFKDVITAIVFLLTVWTSGILIPTLAVLVKRRFSEKAALASIFAGGLSSLLWGIRPLYAIDPLFIGLFFSITFALLIKNWRLKPPVFDTLGKP